MIHPTIRGYRPPVDLSKAPSRDAVVTRRIGDPGVAAMREEIAGANRMTAEANATLDRLALREVRGWDFAAVAPPYPWPVRLAAWLCRVRLAERTVFAPDMEQRARGG